MNLLLGRVLNENENIPENELHTVMSKIPEQLQIHPCFGVCRAWWVHLK
jgi:hypothetical protein